METPEERANRELLSEDVDELCDKCESPMTVQIEGRTISAMHHLPGVRPDPEPGAAAVPGLQSSAGRECQELALGRMPGSWVRLHRAAPEVRAPALSPNGAARTDGVHVLLIGTVGRRLHVDFSVAYITLHFPTA